VSNKRSHAKAFLLLLLGIIGALILGGCTSVRLRRSLGSDVLLDTQSGAQPHTLLPILRTGGIMSADMYDLLVPSDLIDEGDVHVDNGSTELARLSREHRPFGSIGTGSDAPGNAAQRFVRNNFEPDDKFVIVSQRPPVLVRILVVPESGVLMTDYPEEDSWGGARPEVFLLTADGLRCVSSSWFLVADGTAQGYDTGGCTIQELLVKHPWRE
jgi:hypothetical protein